MSNDTQGIVPESSFNATLMRFAFQFTAKYDIRWYLGGVMIKPAEGGGVLIVATDGHRLFVGYDKDGVTNGTYVIKPSAAAVQSCHKVYEDVSARSTRAPVGMKVKVSGTRLTVFDNLGMEKFIQAGSCIIQDGPQLYPNIDKFYPPKREELIPAGGTAIAPSVLLDAIKPFCTRHLGRHAFRMWRRNGASDYREVFLEIDDIPAFVVVMPCHGNDSGHEYFWDKPAKN